ncbi:MAG: 2'-5' RNA ligase family protein [Candidatus Magasanikbacteria bacterium]
MNTRSTQKTNVNKKFSPGHYGFVLKPDSKIREKVEKIQQEFCPNVEFKAGADGDIHLTLYHAPISTVSKPKIDKIIKTVEATGILDERLQLRELEIYGETFLFWSVSTIPEVLTEAHKKALNLANFLQKEASESKENLAGLSEKEQENIKKYNHPLVKDLYKPHITIAYNSTGIEVESKKIENFSHSASIDIEEISFARIGDNGRVEENLLTIS